jgi:glycosyltransferase involved in cell wall biosynthesis
MTKPILYVNIGVDTSTDQKLSFTYPGLNFTTFTAILTNLFACRASIFIRCQECDRRLCTLLSNLLSVNPFLSVTLLISSAKPVNFNCLGSVIYLFLHLLYSFFALSTSVAFLLFAFLFTRFASPPLYSTLSNYSHCIFFTSSLFSPYLRGGSIGHVKGVLSILVQRVSLSLFSTRNFLSELNTCHSNSNFFNYSYPSFLLPDIDLYSISVSFHQFISFLTSYPRLSTLRSKTTFIYTRLSRGGFAAALVSIFLDIPLIVEYNGSEVGFSRLYSERFFLFAFLSRLAESILLFRASRIVTVSQALADQLSQAYPKKDIKWYPNCADTSLTLHVVDRPSDHIAFSYVSTFGKWHGAELIPLALNYILSRHHIYPRWNSVTPKFHIVGDGATYSNFVDLISKFSLSDYFILYGLRSHPFSLNIIGSSHFSLLPTSLPPDKSSFIGSPTKLFEYMALGSIPIASNVGQQYSILKPSVSFLVSSPQSGLNPYPGHDNLGIIFEADSVRSLADAIYFAYTQYSVISHSHANCRKLVASSYTWSANVNSLLC